MILLIYANIAGYGAGVCILEAYLDVNDCNILGNISEYGGGIFLSNSDATVGQTMIKDNKTLNVGGLLTYGSGAGVYCLDSSISIVNSTLLANDANGSGGGMFFSGPSTSGGSQELVNCLIAGNKAIFDGAGLSCNFDAAVDVNNCTLADNTVSDSNYGSGGGLSCYDAVAYIHNSILWNNAARYGSQLSLGDPLDSGIAETIVLITYCDIQGGQANIYQAPGSGPMLIVPPDNPLKNIDPLFVVTSSFDPSKNYYLSHEAIEGVDSPCIDAGSISAEAFAKSVISADINDVNLTTSTDYTKDTDQVDLGYHYLYTVPVLYNLTVQALPDSFYGGIVHGRIWASATGKYGFAISDPTNPPLTTTNSQSGIFGGTKVTIYVEPEPGYGVRWIGTDDDILFTNSNTDTITITMDSDKNIRAEFFLSRTIPVSGGGTALRDAIDDARHGDIFVVAPGTYDGNIDFAGKAITIVSENPDDPGIVAQTIIDCESNSRAFIFANGEQKYSVVDGFTIINGHPLSGNGGAISIGNNCSPTLQNLVIRDCDVSGNGGAIAIGAGSNSNILNVKIENCAATGQGGAVFIVSNSQPVFKYCIFADCYSGVGGAIYANSNTNLIFIECQFTGNFANSQGGAVYQGGGSNLNLQNCDFSTNKSGSYGGAIYYAGQCQTQLNNCCLRHK